MLQSLDPGTFLGQQRCKRTSRRGPPKRNLEAPPRPVFLTAWMKRPHRGLLLKGRSSLGIRRACPHEQGRKTSHPLWAWGKAWPLLGPTARGCREHVWQERSHDLRPTTTGWGGLCPQAWLDEGRVHPVGSRSWLSCQPPKAVLSCRQTFHWLALTLTAGAAAGTADRVPGFPEQLHHPAAPLKSWAWQ